MSKQSDKYWKALAHIMLGTGVLVWVLGWGGLENHYFETLPREANPAIGRVYPYNHHGIIFWQTQTEKWRLDFLEYLSGLLALGGMSIAYWKEHPKRLTEIGKESWTFFCSLFTTAGWSAVSRAIGQEGASIGTSVKGEFTGPDKIVLYSDNSIDNCRTELQKVYLNTLNISGDVNGDRIHLCYGSQGID